MIKGKRTVAVRFGKSWSRREFLVLLSLSYVAPFWLWAGLGLGAWTLLPLLSLPYAAWLARELWTRDQFAELVPMTPRAAQLVMAYAVLLAGGLVLA